MSDKEFTPTEPILMDAPAADIPDTPAEDKPSAAKPAAPSVAPTETRPPVDVPLDDLAYQQYQALAHAVLDSADIASKSAEAAAAASRNMHKATSEFKTLTEVGHKKALILLGAMLFSGALRSRLMAGPISGVCCCMGFVLRSRRRAPTAPFTPTMPCCGRGRRAKLDSSICA